MLDRASLFPLTGRTVLDVGCGAGGWLLEFVQWGADPDSLSGIDLSPARVERARSRIPQADVRTGSGSQLPWPDASFDLVSQFTAFTSILESELKRSVAKEMLRVLRPGGSILWFDFRVNNPRNPNVRGIGASEIRSLFAGCKVDLLSSLLAPPAARLTAGWRLPVAEVLSVVPAFRTHYTGLIRKP